MATDNNDTQPRVTREMVEAAADAYTPFGDMYTALLAAFAAQPGRHQQPLRFQYTNWRGTTAERHVYPLSVRWGSTEWHPEPCWLMRAYDLDKQAEREFAMAGMVSAPAESASQPSPAPAPLDHFVWPSDADRADDEELDRVCGRLEVVEDHLTACAKIVDSEGDLDTTWQAVAALRHEREALAAHVERIVREWNAGDDQFSDEWIERMGDIVEDAPATTLARRDARMKAEELEETADVLDTLGHGAAAQGTRVRAQHYREKAKGLDQ